MIELPVASFIAVLVAVFGAGGGGIWAVGRIRNGNGGTLAEARHLRVVGLLVALETAITDLSHAVTELRIEVAKRD